MSHATQTWRDMPPGRVPSSLEPSPLFYSHFAHTHRLADLGCGRGRTLAGLAGQGFDRLTGLDLNPGALAEARRTLDSQGHRVRLVCGGLHALPFMPGSFEGVLMMAVLTVLPHARARHAALGEVSRVLAPGGRVYVADFALNRELPLYRERYREGRDLGLEPGQFPVRGPGGETLFIARHFADHELEEMFTRAGFRVLGHEQPGVVTRSGNQVRGQVWVGEKA